MRNVFCLAMCLLMLSACAYQPMYGTKKVRSGDQKETLRDGSLGLSQTEIANIPNRAGQILRNDLIDRINYMGYSDKTRFLLEVTLSEERKDLGIKPDNTSSLYVYTVTANVSLRNKETGEIIKQFVVNAEATVNVIRQQFSILTAATTGRKRVLKEIADRIINRLGLYFSTQGKDQLTLENSST